MKVKYSPIGWNPLSGVDALPDTIIEYVDENTLRIDGKLYELDPESVEWPEIFTQTGGLIIEARRDEAGEIWLTIRRFYTFSCTAWDTGGYHDFNGQD